MQVLVIIGRVSICLAVYWRMTLLAGYPVLMASSLLEGYRHRLGRVLSFSQVVGIGTPPTSHPQASVPPPPPSVRGGGAHSQAREGFGESQFRRGYIHCCTLYIYVLCGYCTLFAGGLFVRSGSKVR
jgi:hypothetical protein